MCAGADAGCGDLDVGGHAVGWSGDDSPLYYRRYRPETFGEMIGQSQVTDPP